MTVEEHYKAIAPRLTNWLIATGSSYPNACDLVQEAFLKLWDMRDDLRDNDAAVAGLVFTIAKNLRRNTFRDDKFDYVEEVPEDSKVTGRQLDSSDLGYIRERIMMALESLPPLLREAYSLFQIGELSVREIAHETGAGEDLVKVRIFRAKRKLKEILSQDKELVSFVQ